MNRPRPLRTFDQIYMKLLDMLLRAELTARWCNDKSILFIGDGDAIGLTIAHLATQGLIQGTPKHVTILDFDERIVTPSITSLAPTR
ncbi:MAG: hypothetical protein AVDCRST_MAG64-2979, partial [uncultured Phycisphaerae bacterium]